MSKNKPPIWARVIAMVIAATLDNLFLLIALGWLVAGDVPMFAVFLVIAFFNRLTEIRDAIQSHKPEFILTLNSVLPKKAVAVEEHF